MINKSWTKIFTPFSWNCLFEYDIVTWYLLLFLLSHVNTSLLHKVVIMVKFSQFDNTSSWSESLFVIDKLWIRRKYFVFSKTLGESFKWFQIQYLVIYISLFECSFIFYTLLFLILQYCKKNVKGKVSAPLVFISNIYGKIRISHPAVFLRKSDLKICNKLTGENRC